MNVGKSMRNKENPPFHLGALGIFVIMGLMIFVVQWFEDRAIESNPKYVDGVVMCEHPYHWKRIDYVCFEYKLNNQL